MPNEVAYPSAPWYEPDCAGLNWIEKAALVGIDGCLSKLSDWAWGLSFWNRALLRWRFAEPASLVSACRLRSLTHDTGGSLVDIA